MKKFGTPIGDGPGSDSEKVGFELLGTPLPEGRLALDDFFLPRLARLLWPWWFAGDRPWLEGFCGDDEFGCGVVFVVVVLVLPGPLEREGEVEVELGVVEDELEELDEGGLLVVVELLDELGAGEHDIVSEITGPLIGRFSEDTGVPGGTSMLNVSVTPVSRVTVTVHGSADATGMAAVARTTNRAAASESIARSRRLIFKLARPLLPPSACTSCVEFAAMCVVRAGRY
jgi:hypothetical protein